MVAAVDPGWIEMAGAHLLKRVYTEPQWIDTRGYVAAYETVTLYGLTLAARRRVNYGAIKPLEAREIFVREGLVVGQSDVRGDFLPANRKLLDDVERLEAKIRRRDILVDETALVNFYLARIPERVNTVAAFESWRGKAERASPRLLYMTPADVMAREPTEITPEQFPDELPVAGNLLPLTYRFEPTQADDGLTLTVPEPLVDLLDAGRLAWLVPGMRMEKVTELMRALPKDLRKPLVPVPDSARAALADAPAVPFEQFPDFHEWLAEWITARIGHTVTAPQLVALQIPDALRMNLRVVNENDDVIEEGRDILAIKREVRATQTAVGLAGDEHRHWDFGALPETVDVNRNRLHFHVYPALEDHGTSVGRVEARSAAEAESISRAGLTRLALLTLPQQARFVTQRLAQNRELVLLSSGLALAEPLPQALTWRAVRECFLPDETPLPRTEPAFNELIEARRADLNDVPDKVAELVLDILRDRRAVRLALDRLRSPTFAAAVADIESHLSLLLPPDFVRTTPRSWLEQYPRYLKALRRRIDRLADNVSRDTQLSAQIAPFVSALQTLLVQPVGSRPRPELDQFRWMLEEFRVSLFAQELKTLLRVSDKRLSEQLAKARVEARA
jgi:ATP-dependent helicase HrpA